MKLHLTRAAATAAAVAGLAAYALACDDPIHVVAKRDWPVERYSLVWVTQEGAAGTGQFEQLIQADYLERSNLDCRVIDLSPTAWHEANRNMLAEFRVLPLPALVLLDEQDKPLAAFNSVAEARKRLNPPQDSGLYAIELPRRAARLVAIYQPELSVLAPATLPATQPESVTADQVLRGWQADLSRQPLVVRYAADANVTSQPESPGLSQFERINLRDPGANKALADKLAFRTLPVCMLLAPDGTPLDTFDTPPSAEWLRATVLSPVREQLARSLAEPKNAIVFLLVRGADAQANAQALSAVREASRKAASLNPDLQVPIVQMDPADPRERLLARLLECKPGAAQPFVVPLVGRAKAMPVVESPVSADKLLDQIQLAFHPCGCEVAPRSIGMDLLLGVGLTDAERAVPATQPEAGRWRIRWIAPTIVLALLVLMICWRRKAARV